MNALHDDHDHRGFHAHHAHPARPWRARAATRVLVTSLLLLLLALATDLARAHRHEAEEHGGAAPASRSSSPLYQQECGACHLAYPPQLLPAASWQRLSAHLDHHFGVDASLDAEPTRQIAAWLQAHAGTGRRVAEAAPEDRISRSAWFQRKHHEVSAAAWKRPAIKSAANCSACHPQAAQGDFDEDRVHIPR
jgi:hypothetical protein